MMKLSCCFIVFTASVISVTLGLNKNVIIQHKSSMKYIAWFNGIQGSLVTFTPNQANAQRFQLEMDDYGYMWIITSDGSALWDKRKGCDSQTNYLIYETAITGDNQLFTLNNDGTIGSKCCNTCLLLPNPEYMLLTVEKYSCSNNNLANYQFTVVPVDY